MSEVERYKIRELQHPRDLKTMNAVYENSECVLAVNYDAMVKDRDQISLALAVAKADRDKWFNRAKELERELAECRK